MTPTATLDQAMQYHQAGALSQAEYLYRQILESNPNDADAMHLLGMVAYQVGQPQAALPYLQRAIEQRPGQAHFHVNLGLAYRALGRLDDALASFRLALELDPRVGGACNNIGNILRAQNRLGEAALSYRQALELQPDLADAHNNLGAVLAAQGKMDEAIACYEQALALNPNYAEIHNNLGLALLKRGKLDDAEACWRRAIRLKPENPEPHNNLGYALRMKGQWQEAVACLQQALQLKPDHASACYNLGSVFAEMNDWDKAEACFQHTLRLKPDYAEAHEALGTLLNDRGKADEALACFQQALQCGPTARLRIALATRLPFVYQSMAELESCRSRLIREVGQLHQQNVVHELTEEAALGLFYLPYQGLNDRDILRDVARLYRAPQPVRSDLAAGTSSPSRKIRVGFLSGFFRSHTIGHWMRGLIAHLSRDDFEVIVLSVGCHDDRIASFIKEHADRYLVVPTHLPSARRVIVDQHLDVLFYTDIGMGHMPYTLAFSRLAPVQCVTVGHPVTTGIPTVDYYISSEQLEIDEAQEHYTEKLVRLKALPVYFYRPENKASGSFVRSTLGADSAEEPDPFSHIYACLQAPYKFHPEFDELLGGILRGDPQGTLVLSRWSVPPFEQPLRERFATTLADVVDRIRFLPFLGYQDYLAVLELADVQLDPLHFGGGMTSYEGLSLGTPIVTLPSQFLPGRITLSLYKQMQLLDCVASSRQEYINLAVKLGTDPDYRASIKEKILAANGVLFENSAGMRELEQFLRQAVARADKGLSS